VQTSSKRVGQIAGHSAVAFQSIRCSHVDVATRPFFGPGSKSCHAAPSGTELAGLAFPLPAGATPDLESTMKVHTFTVATAAAAFLAASTMATFAQTGSGSGTGSGTRSTTTTPSTTAPRTTSTTAPSTTAPRTTSTTAPSTTAPRTTSTTAQKNKQVNCPGHAEDSQGRAKEKNPNCR
jgi:hypothetical protein